MTPDKYQAMAVKTFNGGDNPTRHALLGLAGEAGELIELYKKDQYKPGFDWWDCKCKWGKNDHRRGETPNGKKCDYTPLILDELGDWWYYYRIVSFIYGKPISHLNRECYYNWDIDKLLGMIAQNSAVMLNDWLDKKQIDGSRLKVLWGCFAPLLDKLDCTLDHLTDLNYCKLNSEPTAHGWKR